MFEWDADNLRKITAHDLTTEEVESAFLDPFVMDGGAQEVDDETRWVLLGMTNTGKLIRVIYTDRVQQLRVVTAHKGTRGQQQRYAQHRLDLLRE